MKAKKNIGIMSWSLNNGGAERAVANLAKDLSEKYNVYIILFDAENITYPYGGTVIDLEIPMGTGTIQKSLTLIKRYLKLKKIKKQFDIHTMISFMPHINLYNILTKGSDKAIISIRNNMSQSRKTKFANKLMVWEGKKADMTVSLSEGVRQDLIHNFGYFPDKVVTIYNSCDINWITRQSEDVDKLIEEFDFSEPVLVTVGRLTHQKGQWHLLRALSILKEKKVNCKLVIFGQGEYLDKLKAYAEKLGVSNRCFFMGYVKNHHRFMKKCDMFVFPSLFEGLGNVLLEALACGMPVISMDCPSGPMEILNSSVGETVTNITWAKYGVLVPAFSNNEFDVDDNTFERSDYLLADAIVGLLTDEELKKKYRKQAEIRIRDFAPDRIKQQWIDLIEGNYDC